MVRLGSSNNVRGMTSISRITRQQRETDRNRRILAFCLLGVVLILLSQGGSSSSYYNGPETTSQLLTLWNQEHSTDYYYSNHGKNNQPFNSSSLLLQGLRRRHDDASINNKPNDNNAHRAIFLISMGPKSLNGTLVERFYWSARNIGQYDGWIVLLTDAPAWRYHGLAQNAAYQPANQGQSSPHWDDKFVIFHTSLHRGLTEDGGSDLQKFDFEAMRYKVYKSYILEYLDLDRRLDEVQVVYYLDVDIVIGNRLQNLFDGLEQEYKILQDDNDNNIPKMYMFQGNRNNHSSYSRAQGGQFVLHRQASRTCLQNWRDSMLLNVTEEQDQRALDRLFDKDRYPQFACQPVTMARNPKYITFPQMEHFMAHWYERNLTQEEQAKVGDYTITATNWLTNHLQHRPVLYHFLNTGVMMLYVQPCVFENYLRMVLQFTPTQPDPLGLTGKHRMVVPGRNEKFRRKKRYEVNCRDKEEYQ